MQVFSSSLGNRYSTLGELTHSGSSRIHLVEDGDGHRFVLKLVEPASELRRERVLREAWLQRRLSHPGICPVTDVMVTRRGLGVITPYIEGPTLRGLLRHQPLGNLEIGLSLLRMLVDAVAVAHAYGIVHRDLKPSNVLLHPGDVLRPVVIDFGIARLPESDTTLEGYAMGTPGYMAPEQFDQPQRVLASADVFALGAIGYHLLAGRRAFPARDLQQANSQARRGAYRDIPRSWPSTLQALVRAMLHPDLTSRPRDAGEVLEVLNHLTSAEPPAALRQDGATWWAAKMMSQDRNDAAQALSETTLELPSRRLTTLPAVERPLVGRDDEKAVIIERLRVNRRLTLVGMPGVGKTRLALQIGHETIGEYPDGALWIDVSGGLDVRQALRIALKARGEEIEDLCDALTMLGQVLLIVDGQRADGEDEGLVDDLVLRCPMAAALKTARSAHPDSPTRFPVLPLTWEDEAGRGRLARALAAGAPHAAALTDEEVDTILEAAAGHPGRFLALVNSRGLVQATQDPTASDEALLQADHDRVLQGWLRGLSGRLQVLGAAVAAFGRSPRIQDLAGLLRLEEDQCWAIVDEASMMGILRVRAEDGVPRVAIDPHLRRVFWSSVLGQVEHASMVERHRKWVCQRVEESDRCGGWLEDVLTAAERVDVADTELLSALYEVMPHAERSARDLQRAVRLVDRLGAKASEDLRAALDQRAAELEVNGLGPDAARPRLERWEGAQLPELVWAALTGTSGWVSCLAGDLEAARRKLLLAVETGDDRTAIVSSIRLSQVYIATDDITEAVRTLRTVLPRTRDDEVSGAKVRALLGTCAGQVADFDLAFDLLRGAVNIFRRHDAQRQEVWTRLTLLSLSMRSGIPGDIEAQINRVNRLIPGTLDPNLRAFHVGTQAEWMLAQGQPASALFLVDESLREFGSRAPRRQVGLLRRLRAEALVSLLDLDAAWEELAEARWIVESAGVTSALLDLDLDRALVAIMRHPDLALDLAEDVRRQLVVRRLEKDPTPELLDIAWSRALGQPRPRTPCLDEMKRRSSYQTSALRRLRWVENMFEGALLPVIDAEAIRPIVDDDTPIRRF